MARIQKRSIAVFSIVEYHCHSNKFKKDLRNATPVKTRLFDLPVELILNVADFLPREYQACLALTCHGARDIFKKKIRNLSKRERQRFLMALLREAPTKIICQHRLQLVDYCHGPQADPGDRLAVKALKEAYLFQNLHPDRQPCKLTACVPIPSIKQAEFILTHEHVQRVMLRHRLGRWYGVSLDSLSHSSSLSKKEKGTGDYTCDTTLRFCIADDNKLYMRGKYEFRGQDLVRALTFTRHQFDICPHLYLDHLRRPYQGRHRLPVRLPGSECCIPNSYCHCMVHGTYDPSWTACPSVHDREGYVAPPSSCHFCATDLALYFDDLQNLQTLKVSFWRCLGDGGFQDCDSAWLRGALNEQNERGNAIRNPPGPLPRLIWLESFEKVSRSNNTT